MWWPSKFEVIFSCQLLLTADNIEVPNDVWVREINYQKTKYEDSQRARATTREAAQKENQTPKTLICGSAMY